MTGLTDCLASRSYVIRVMVAHHAAFVPCLAACFANYGAETKQEEEVGRNIKCMKYAAV